MATYLPDTYDPSAEDEAMVEEIHALNREMIAAAVRKFACGVGPACTLRAQPDGEMLLTDGPYLETKENMGVVSILCSCAHTPEKRAGRLGDGHVLGRSPWNYCSNPMVAGR